MNITLEELEKKEIEYLNCLQACISYLFSKNGDEYDSAYALGLGIYCKDSKEECLGRRIFPNITYNFKDFYREEYGYEIKSYNNRITDGIILKNLAEKRDCLIGFDAYYCRWSPTFNEIHIQHFALIEEIDINNRKIVVRDPYITENPVVTDLETIFEGINKVYSIEKRKKYTKESKSTIYHLLELVVYGKSIEQTENNYNKMIREFVKVNSIEELFEKKHLQVIQLLYLLIRLKIITMLLCMFCGSMLKMMKKKKLYYL
ncbi:MAG: hypothetical protein IJJ59_02380 [Pseudobutyrivibrio sp.]|uniref:hypothetical protein n=1 Tax=Pseudobutyrivibrio sp. TaxID=2014367 RepID=UPI0025F471BC|nr:hypothetical protein [Pseudobutyrivibrio sp.]MBQ6462154.1 hypothetical protein [Pseudobutyrivibrio sp.]